ncbi:MAG: PQQ-binding-like beta-propeller repeat protein [Acidimicrobiales bacterium]|nr:PQQ-binding-like beta-propeller repeat protein [Acidimicrobiales bacterium]
MDTRRILIGAIAAVIVVGVALAALDRGDDADTSAGPIGSTDTDNTGGARDGDDSSAPVSSPTPLPAPTPLPPLPPSDAWVNPASVGRPDSTVVAGSLTFRGSATRTWYGSGPVPTAPEVVWRFPAAESEMLCSMSTVGVTTSEWCGTGWTGQPAVFERDGRTWLVVGAFDGSVHFLDALTGERILADFETGDIIKGSVTIDPDGYPLVYVGSRDNHLRVIAFDRDEPTELWSLAADAVAPTLWNDDWDGTPLVIDDHLFEGGENSQLHIVRLHRTYGADGLVTVDPELIFNAPGWDDQLLADVGDENVSIESSVAASGDTIYFANSGGLVQGWDIGPLRTGGVPERVFRFWTGDDTDATVVIDADGKLYVGSEYERFNARATTVGQFMQLDPARPEDPLVWSIPIQQPAPAGVWATAALHRDVVYVPTNEGFLHGIDRATGEIRWTKKLQGPTWSSPVVVDDVLLQADCEGLLHAYDVSDTTIDPPELWQVRLDWCIESTPTVWRGRIYVGDRSGRIFAIADPGS